MLGLWALLAVLPVQAISPLLPPSAAPPPPQTPLQVRVPALLDGVVRGDPVAMCALASALDQCATYAGRLVELRDYLQLRGGRTATGQDSQASAVRAADDARVRAQLEPGLLAWARAFVGASHYTRAQRIDLWHDAAQAGNRTALAMYGSGAVFRIRGDEDPAGLAPQLAVYRRQAERLALSAARGGDAVAVSALASAYGGGDPPQPQDLLAKAVQPDRAKAAALLARLARAMHALPATRENWARRNFAGFQLERLRAGLSSGEVARAQALGRAWDRRWAPIDTSPAALAAYWPASEAAALAQADCSR